MKQFDMLKDHPAHVGYVCFHPDDPDQIEVSFRLWDGKFWEYRQGLCRKDAFGRYQMFYTNWLAFEKL